ncbi:MAG: cytochrome c biogenesis protein ResB [Candidatus Omnitrophica bacterium]|nr:cytochrome c biogenesis protein ResB [Candidatus Omnitrophota bacterium]
MMNLIKKLGSVGFTVAISLALILLLIVSTSMEAINGTPFAQKMFYQTRWFEVLLSFLWINIFCSTILRFPFKKGHIGFLITHVGILGLLTGALIASSHGVDGEMTIFEGETSATIRQSGYVLGVGFPNQEETTFDLKKGIFQFVLTKARMNATVPFCPLEQKKSSPSGRLPPLVGEMVSFNVTDILENATERMIVTPASLQAPINHAVQVKINSKQMGENSSVWLVEQDANNPSSHEMMAGSIKLVLKAQPKSSVPQKPELKVFDKSGKEIAVIHVSEGTLPQSIPIAETGSLIKDLEYYPFATVSGKNKLMNYPEGKRFNPAVVFNLVDSSGVATRKVKFAFFPEFESMHPQGAPKADDILIKFDAGNPGDFQDTFDGPQISFFYTQDDTFGYQSRLHGKVVLEGNVEAGKCLPAGWMDVEFCVEKTLTRASVSYDIAETKDDHGLLAAAVTIPSVSGGNIHWVFDNRSTPVSLKKDQVYFFLTQKTLSIPFSLTLKEFRKIDYPGTQDAASFESDVVLTDAKRKISLERTISMNHPLEYDGYKVFQSSYLSDPKAGKGSVFTVAKNPGIPWIYIGSIFACIGALFQFYWTKEKTALS